MSYHVLPRLTTSLDRLHVICCQLDGPSCSCQTSTWHWAVKNEGKPNHSLHIYIQWSGPHECVPHQVPPRTCPNSTSINDLQTLRTFDRTWVDASRSTNITNVNKLRASHHVHRFPTLDKSTFPPYTEIIVDQHSSGVQIGIVLYTAKLRCLICCLTVQVFLAQIPSECHHGSP